MDGLKILDMPPISPYSLEQVEKALNIKLYDWLLFTESVGIDKNCL